MIEQQRTTQEQPWVDGLTFSRVLDTTCGRQGDCDALIFPWINHRRTYRQFHAEVAQLARALLALDVRPGDHVGIWVTNLPQWVLTQFATAAIGAVLVNINPAYRSQELTYVLAQADITVLILTDRFKSTDYFALLTEVAPELATAQPGTAAAGAFPRLRWVVSIHERKPAGALSWSELLDRASSIPEADLRQREQQVQPGDVVNIQYTSGTTGFPKGAMLTHCNLLLNAYHVGHRLAFTERDRLAIAVPFYHCFGCVMGTLMCAIHGAAMVIPAEGFDPLATLRAIQDEHCTGVYGVPTMFIAELNHPRFAEFDLRSLRTGIMAGSPCPIEVMRQVVDRMGAREMTIAYGLTEASPVITQTETTDSLEDRVGTVGKPLPGFEVRIAQPGSDIEVSPGQAGELLARGHGIMKGYYNKPAETAAAISAGLL
jgi:fatty-acyl-CoA synthase